MGQYFRGEANGYPFNPLCQEQRELYGECYRLLISAVVAEHPLRGFGVEYHIEGKFRKPCLNVSGSSGSVAGEYIAPVALRVDEQLFLAQLHQGIANGGIAMGVILHGVPNDVGHLVIATVVKAFHGVENTPLHRLQPVV